MEMEKNRKNQKKIEKTEKSNKNRKKWKIKITLIIHEFIMNLINYS